MRRLFDDVHISYWLASGARALLQTPVTVNSSNGTGPTTSYTTSVAPSGAVIINVINNNDNVSSWGYKPTPTCLFATQMLPVPQGTYAASLCQMLLWAARMLWGKLANAFM